MSCERFEELMLDSLYGELGEAAEASLRAHLNECADCRGEFESLRATVATMSRRERPDPGRAYWDGYWDRLAARMAEERALAPSAHRSWWRQNAGSPARWAYRVAAAAAILAVGVFAGRTFFAPEMDVTPGQMIAEQPAQQTNDKGAGKTSGRASDDAATPDRAADGVAPPLDIPDEQVAGKGDDGAATVAQNNEPATTPGSDDAGKVPSPASEPMEVVPASSDRALRYIQKSQLLLVALVNTDPSSPDGYAAGLGGQQERSRTLVNEAEEIKEELSDPRQRRLRELVTELEKILIQIANLESEEDMDAVEFIRSRVNEHDVLFKINLEQMRHGTDVDGSAGEAQGSNSQRSI
jgi:hypothetical protein